MSHARPPGRQSIAELPAPSHAERARTLAAAARVGTLATIAHPRSDVAGHPYASLVAVAFDLEGRPVMRLSSLAEHTQNVVARADASFLVAEALAPGGDPLALGRMTMLGPCVRVPAADVDGARATFLAAHPRASQYVDFRDFAFWRLELTSIRYIGGFGRMSWIDAAAYREAHPDPLAESAAGILSHMNGDHAAAVLAYAQGLAGCPAATAARMTSVDRYGFELEADTAEGLKPGRVAFDAPVSTPDEVRKAMVAMVQVARARLAAR